MNALTITSPYISLWHRRQYIHYPIKMPWCVSIVRKRIDVLDAISMASQVYWVMFLDATKSNHAFQNKSYQAWTVPESDDTDSIALNPFCQVYKVVNRARLLVVIAGTTHQIPSRHCQVRTATYLKIEGRDQSGYAPGQWETSLQCNDVSHWLGAYLGWSLWRISDLRTYCRDLT